MFTEAITKEQIEVPFLFQPEIRKAVGENTVSAVWAVAMGFSVDPVARWMYPEPADHIRWFPSFVRAFAGKAFESGTAFISSDLAGAALWLPPGVEPDGEAIEVVVENSATEDIKRHMPAIFEAMADWHPKEPHWYLPMIGVDPFMQGKGIGSALVARSLELVDADELPAYLESSNPRNIGLYQRFGFEVVGSIKVGDAPPLFPMYRKAKK